jgi:enamine deaminase RidA (YjgF/YER057c/UK114 family)
MSKEYISSNLLVSSPLFSAGVKAGNFLYTSGQIALDASTEKLKILLLKMKSINV